MNWTQFKDPVSHMCLAGTAVASWSLTQKVAGSSPFDDKYFLSINSVKKIRKNSNVLLTRVHVNLSLIGWVSSEI